jgi:hypothetical protein
MQIIIVVLSLLLTSLSLNAQEYNALSGEYTIAGKTVIDPPADEARNTHIYFALAGDAARDLYNTMKASAKTDDCGEAGGLIKTIGAMQCTRSAGGKSFHCDFAIDIAKQQISGASAC